MVGAGAGAWHEHRGPARETLLVGDLRDVERARTILADEVTVETPGGSARGPEAVIEQARRNHTVRTQHVITDVLIKLEGDRAEAGANLIVTFVPDSDQPDARLTVGSSQPPPSRLTIGERYRFAAMRGEAGWRLRRIEVTRVWSTQPLPAGARVAQADGGATAVESSSR